MAISRANISRQLRGGRKVAAKKKKKQKKNWIPKNLKKGALRKSLGVKEGKKIPAKKLAAAAKKPGKLGQRARLAQTFKKMNRRKA